MRRLLVLILAMLPSATLGGEVTYTQWDKFISRLEITYFDTTGTSAVCTVFYNSKPVGDGSAYFYNGIANVKVSVPSGVVGSDKVTYACRTE